MKHGLSLTARESPLAGPFDVCIVNVFIHSCELSFPGIDKAHSQFYITLSPTMMLQKRACRLRVI